MPDVVHGSLYDYPKYYDLLFGSDWKAEFDFLRACFEKYAGCRVRRVFEPACGTGRLLVEVDDQGRLDPEHGIVVEVVAAGHEDVGDQRAVARRADHEVEMGGPHRAALGRPQELADGSVVGDRVGRRSHAPEAVAAVVTREQVRAATGGAVLVLHVVEPRVVGFPDLEARAGDRAAVLGSDHPLHVGGLTARALRDIATELDPRRTLDEARAELLDQVSAFPSAVLGDSAVGSEVEIIKSQAIALRVVDRLGLAEFQRGQPTPCS
jgi:hypothetical protein